MHPIRLERAEFLRAQRLHLRWSWRKSGLIAFACLVAFVLIFIFLALRQRYLACVLIGVLFGCAFGFVFARYIYLPLMMPRIFRQQKSLQRETIYSWDGDRLTVTSGDDHWSHEWSELSSWKEDREFVLIYLSDLLFYVIPKRVFDSEAEVADLRSHLQGHVRSRR